MKTFYTILKLSPNTIAGDSLSIGLLVCSGDEYWLKISETKKNIIKKLLVNKTKSVDFVLKQLENYLKQLKTTSEHGQLFPLERFITADYIDYLNIYSNGLLQFSKVSMLEDNFNYEKFLKLYSLFIEKESELKLSLNEEKRNEIKLSTNHYYETDLNINKKVQLNLIQRVENKIHTEITLNHSNLKSLYFNINVDCIGLNGSFVGAKTLSLENTVQTLEKNVSHYITLIAFLSQQYKKDLDKNNFFLITDEPERKTPEHKFWEEMKNVPSFEMIPSDEAEKVAEVVEETGATKFL
ncbi:hypothetical protein J2799_004494 [Chryseobacterium vietnamense]|uniref:hypothetical protein n=1 Tax=Chryseobacterium vietnamense TaxID=866785 RepID=UPI0028661D74|nr:hypothetical protein [Chryseobacterium vietnamense]MDR6489944.1 hypothetical protein [Chryseobacterium vietnamense]